MGYQEFLASKLVTQPPTGLATVPPLNPQLFPFEKDIVTWALKRGRAAIFADCGMGKTFMQLEWARCMDGEVLILAPLAVATQTCAEGSKFGIDLAYARSPSDISQRITITNYEMLEKFDPARFRAVVLDESSILKSYTGKFRTLIIDMFKDTPFRLACTATPAPNDHIELGNHAEFLGIMSRTEMLAMYFLHDGGSTQNWRLKGHAENAFWRWLASWAVMIRKPSDLGYDDGDFILPPLEPKQIIVDSNIPTDGMLFPMEAKTLGERRAARRNSTGDRVAACAELANASREPWIVWCDMNAESVALAAAIDGAKEVTGSMSPEDKERILNEFSRGELRVLVSKPSIAGFGMNWQHCANVAFVGLSDSWEQYYQAIRRCWRFGQKQTVRVYVIASEQEGAVIRNIERKELDAQRMAEGMVGHMRETMMENMKGITRMTDEYKTTEEKGEGWRMILGDCVESVRAMPDESIHYSIFSPPFASLYTYSNSERDMGNCKDSQEFLAHFEFLAGELFRVIKTGRLLSFHCMLLPTSKARDGIIGLRDFRGDMIRIFERAGFVFHSEVVIWKDPVTAMQRTKALGLLHKQLKKDSCMSRQGIPDYLVTMRKPGVNAEPVSHTNESFPVGVWQNYASPIWMDIEPNDTLQYRRAREDKDERHICPLQLEVIRRALRLWTNKGDLVLSPFGGIASEGYVALQMAREYIGVELKESYFVQACKNLQEAKRDLGELFELAAQ